MRLLEGHDADVALFVARFSPVERPVWEPGFRAFGVIRDDGALVAGVVFDQWRPQFSTLELSASAVSSHAFSPQIIRQLGEYAFGKLLSNRVWARTAANNHRATKLLRHIGFIPESVSADHYGVGQHAVTYRMLRREWIRRYGNLPIECAA